MTLDAHRLEPMGDIQLFAATSASQGRGYSITVHRGFIAVRGNEHFRADTLTGAAKGVSRKSRVARRFDAYAASTEDFVRRYQSYRCDVNL